MCLTVIELPQFLSLCNTEEWTATNRHFLFNVRLQFSLTIFTLQEACLFVYIANDEDSFGNKSLQEQYMKLFLNLKIFNETKLQPSIRV